MTKYVHFNGVTHIVDNWYDTVAVVYPTGSLPSTNMYELTDQDIGKWNGHFAGINYGNWLVQNGVLFNVVNPIVSLTMSGTSPVVLNLGSLTGFVRFGDGNNRFTSSGEGNNISAGNGNNSTILNSNQFANDGIDDVTLGSGNNTVTITGHGFDIVTLGNGRNIVNDSGAYEIIKADNGNNTIIANGSHDKITLGFGDNTVTAFGASDAINVSANSNSINSIKMGMVSSLRISGGKDQIAFDGPVDKIYANGLVTGSTISAIASSSLDPVPGGSGMMFIGSNSSGVIKLNSSHMSDTITIQALGSDHSYTGNIEISGFSAITNTLLGDHINLNGLGFSSFTQLKAATKFTSTGEVVSLHGGGHLTIDGSASNFTAAQFSFSTHYGAV